MKKPLFNFLVIAIIGAILISAALFLQRNFFEQNYEIEEADIPLAEIEHITPAEPLPNFSFFDEKGESHNITQYSGKILLINFWASWCKPCIKELPQFDQMVEIYGEENIEIIPISIDSASDMAKLRKFYKDNNIKNLKLYHDKDLAAYEEVRSFGVPTTIVVDRNMKAHLKVSGYLNWLDPQMMSVINGL